MKQTTKVFLSVLFCSLFAWSALTAADLRFAPIFGQGMVLQRNQEVNVWGTAPASAPVTVSIQGKSVPAESDAEGNWRTTLSGLTAGGPFELKLNSGSISVVLKDVYVGEVWMAGGQSNMQFSLLHNADAERYLAEATNPDIRYLQVPIINYEGEPVKNNELKWRQATGGTAKGISAVAYFFAKDLQEKLKVPIGVICAYKGGTPAETWMSKTSITSNPALAVIWDDYQALVNSRKEGEYEQLFDEYQEGIAKHRIANAAGATGLKAPIEPMGPKHHRRPAGLYETMLTRVFPYTVRGVIWYQGEANASRAEQYKTLFPALIAEWRDKFEQKDLPFYFVQLSNYSSGGNRNTFWTELQEAQLETWKTVPNTAMAVSIDYGDSLDIHPKQKEPIGKRLAASARHLLYGESDLVYSGPIYKSSAVRGNRVEISFDHTGSGLKADGPLKGFTVCGADKQFVPAQAVIEGNTILVSAASVPEPQAVRYGWVNYTDANLFNKEGFPASPFRTDDFAMTTKGRRK
ncbi:MAG: sialate O-acetylesterase [Tannerella sp.]|jgi:sialate O-acetylesterase|nr:sialate O-acetylesterase [Tannerella sp.]